MQKRIDTLQYIIGDWLSTALAWFIFFYYRKFYIASHFFGDNNYFDFDKNLVGGMLIIPACWLVLYTLMGTYGDVYRKSRLNELGRTLLATVIGVTILFFIIILDDIVFRLMAITVPLSPSFSSPRSDLPNTFYAVNTHIVSF